MYIRVLTVPEQLPFGSKKDGGKHGRISTKYERLDIAFGRGGIQSLLILAQNKTYRNRQKIIDKYVKMIKFLADNMVYYIIG